MFKEVVRRELVCKSSHIILFNLYLLETMRIVEVGSHLVLDVEGKLNQVLSHSRVSCDSLVSFP